MNTLKALLSIGLTSQENKDEDTKHLREYGDITFDVEFSTAQTAAVTMVFLMRKRSSLIR